MKIDLDRVAAAVKALPERQRPYSLRDTSEPTGSLSDILTDLAPFIEAEIARALESDAAGFVDAGAEI